MKYVSTSDADYNDVINWEDRYISLFGNKVDSYAKDGINLVIFCCQD